MSDIIRVGQQVPDMQMEIFNPKDGSFGKISFSDYSKKKKALVLFFYPADYTFVCPTELADVAKHYAEIEKAGAEVISVSTDTKFVHLAWLREEKILSGVKFPMGSDPTGKIARLFGVYDEAEGLALRGTFIINSEGKLTMSEVNFYNVGRNAKELVRKINADLYLQDHPNEACPANWSAGQKTLTPNESMVGRVQEALAGTN